MYDRPTGRKNDDVILDLTKKLPQGYDPYARAGSYYVPNSISRRERITNSIIGALLFTYGTYGVWQDDIWVPGRFTSGVHVHGVAAWLFYMAILCGVAMLISTVVDHYDTRRNEHKYTVFSKAVGRIGVAFFVGSLVWHVYELFPK